MGVNQVWMHDDDASFPHPRCDRLLVFAQEVVSFFGCAHRFFVHFFWMVGHLSDLQPLRSAVGTVE